MRAGRGFRSLALKYSGFTAVLVLWVVAISIVYDVGAGVFTYRKALMLCLVVFGIGHSISVFTHRLLVRPLELLRNGISKVGEGRLEAIQVSRTRDEIEDLGESFNQMIAALAESRREVQQHREQLQERIRQRTMEVEAAMERALAANKAKSEFLTNMSHELRTPMNGVLGMIDIVLDSRLNAEQREQLETAQRCANSLLALLNDLLDLSKIEAGRMILEKIPFEVRRLVDECVKAHLPHARQKGLELSWATGEEVPPMVVGDPLRIRQIMTNLLSNAIKFTERGWVRLRIGSRAGQPGEVVLSIRVEDSGSGIPADKLDMIFEKFTQADGSIGRRFGGTGLGLAITSRLVGMHGGRIRVESELGRGSTFLATLRCEACAETAAPASGDRTCRRPAQQLPAGRRVLVVEDNVVNQKIVTAILKKSGYAVDVASDGQEALAVLASGQAPDAVLMDIQMPVLDGLETTRRIRAEGRWSQLPLIAMTAHAMTGDRERCLAAGMSAYLSKPVDAPHLLATLEAQFARLPGGSAPANPKPANGRGEPSDPLDSSRFLPAAG